MLTTQPLRLMGIAGGMLSDTHAHGSLYINHRSSIFVLLARNIYKHVFIYLGNIYILCVYWSFAYIAYSRKKYTYPPILILMWLTDNIPTLICYLYPKLQINTSRNKKVKCQPAFVKILYILCFYWSCA